jgi:hypothetical protein
MSFTTAGADPDGGDGPGPPRELARDDPGAVTDDSAGGAEIPDPSGSAGEADRGATAEQVGDVLAHQTADGAGDLSSGRAGVVRTTGGGPKPAMDGSGTPSEEQRVVNDAREEIPEIFGQELDRAFDQRLWDATSWFVEAFRRSVPADDSFLLDSLILMYRRNSDAFRTLAEGLPEDWRSTLLSWVSSSEVGAVVDSDKPEMVLAAATSMFAKVIRSVDRLENTSGFYGRTYLIDALRAAAEQMGREAVLVVLRDYSGYVRDYLEKVLFTIEPATLPDESATGDLWTRDPITHLFAESSGSALPGPTELLVWERVFQVSRQEAWLDALAQLAGVDPPAAWFLWEWSRGRLSREFMRTHGLDRHGFHAFQRRAMLRMGNILIEQDARSPKRALGNLDRSDVAEQYGIPRAIQLDWEIFCREFGVEIWLCPANVDATDLQAQEYALGHAKEKQIKYKSLGRLDRYLFPGMQDSDLGWVFCYEPGPVPEGIDPELVPVLEKLLEQRLNDRRDAERRADVVLGPRGEVFAVRADGSLAQQRADIDPYRFAFAGGRAIDDPELAVRIREEAFRRGLIRHGCVLDWDPTTSEEVANQASLEEKFGPNGEPVLRIRPDGSRAGVHGVPRDQSAVRIAEIKRGDTLTFFVREENSDGSPAASHQPAADDAGGSRGGADVDVHMNAVGVDSSSEFGQLWQRYGRIIRETIESLIDDDDDAVELLIHRTVVTARDAIGSMSEDFVAGEWLIETALDHTYRHLRFIQLRDDIREWYCDAEMDLRRSQPRAHLLAHVSEDALRSAIRSATGGSETARWFEATLTEWRNDGKQAVGDRLKWDTVCRDGYSLVRTAATVDRLIGETVDRLLSPVLPREDEETRDADKIDRPVEPARQKPSVPGGEPVAVSTDDVEVENEMANAAKSGDAGAFEQVWARVENDLIEWAILEFGLDERSMSESIAEIRDSARLNIAFMPEGGKFREWSARVAYNWIHERERLSGLRESLISSYLLGGSVGSDSAVPAIRRCSDAQLRDALGKFIRKPRAGELLRLTAHGFSPPAIAVMLGMRLDRAIALQVETLTALADHISGSSSDTEGAERESSSSGSLRAAGRGAEITEERIAEVLDRASREMTAAGVEENFGVPAEDQVRIQEVTDALDIVLEIRSSRDMINGHTILPITGLDTLLGADEMNNGLLALYDPVLPPKPPCPRDRTQQQWDAQWELLVRRYQHRKRIWEELSGTVDLDSTGALELIGDGGHRRYATSRYDLVAAYRADGTLIADRHGYSALREIMKGIPGLRIKDSSVPPDPELPEDTDDINAAGGPVVDREVEALRFEPWRFPPRPVSGTAPREPQSQPVAPG